MNISKSEILNPESGDNAAVKLALAETHYSRDQDLPRESRRQGLHIKWLFKPRDYEYGCSNPAIMNETNLLTWSCVSPSPCHVFRKPMCMWEYTVSAFLPSSCYLCQVHVWWSIKLFWYQTTPESSRSHSLFTHSRLLCRSCRAWSVSSGLSVQFFLLSVWKTIYVWCCHDAFIGTWRSEFFFFLQNTPSPTFLESRKYQHFPRRIHPHLKSSISQEIFFLQDGGKRWGDSSRQNRIPTLIPPWLKHSVTSNSQ